jgi:tetratricopeptide (TPR) repeat protein
MKKNAFRFALIVLIFASAPARAQSQLVAGKNLLQQGKPGEALVELRKAVARAPKNTDAWYWLGEAYLQNNKPDSAAAAAEKILWLDKKLASGYLLAAKSGLARKNLAEAKDRLRQGIKYNKKDAALLILLGQALAQSDSLDMARVVFSHARLLQPNNPNIYEASGDIYMKQGGTGPAIFEYESAVQLDSLRPDLHYKLAKAYFSQRRYNEAARELLTVAKLDTTNHEAVFELAKLYFAAKQYANASVFLRTCVRRNPGSQEAWPMYLEALYFSKQYGEVPAAANRVLQFKPGAPEALKMLAHAQFEQREFEQAVATYQQLGQKEVLTEDDMKRLGNAYAATKRDSLAANTFEEIIRQGTKDADVYGDLGVVYMRQQRFDKSAAAFEGRFKLDSTAISAYINYALSNMALSKWEPARGALVRALRLKPDYLKGYLYLARCYTQIDSLAQAKRAGEALVHLAGNDAAAYKDELAEAHGLIGFVHLLNKSYPEALAALNASIKLVDNNAQTRWWRAQALALSGKRDDAIEEYKKALKLDPNNKNAKKELESLQPK